MRSLGVALVLSTWAASASAGPICGSRDVIVDRLTAPFGETRRAIGLASNGLIEIYASDVGSWTILLTSAKGVTCLVSHGEAFEALRSRPDGWPL